MGRRSLLMRMTPIFSNDETGAAITKILSVDEVLGAKAMSDVNKDISVMCNVLSKQQIQTVA